MPLTPSSVLCPPAAELHRPQAYCIFLDAILFVTHDHEVDQDTHANDREDGEPDEEPIPGPSEA